MHQHYSVTRSIEVDLDDIDGERWFGSVDVRIDVYGGDRITPGHSEWEIVDCDLEAVTTCDGDEWGDTACSTRTVTSVAMIPDAVVDAISGDIDEAERDAVANYDFGSWAGEDAA